jgi:ABC-2 type transport system ATP-binding protein
MEKEAVIKIQNVTKSFKGFTLDIPALEIPKGFATALIGENGAGKSTLINILAGVRLDYKGEIEYFGGEKNEEVIREWTGYTGPGNYFMPHWTVESVGEISGLLFDGFHLDRYQQLCRELGVDKKSTRIDKLSDGMKMKTMLSVVFARDTKMLLLDEPASPLDPLMRDTLCSMLRDYLEEGEGEKSVFFSTHNIADMENVTDYAIIMEQGKVVEQGFVEDLKEKYVVVKGEPGQEDKVKNVLWGYRKNNYGYEGLCLAADLEKLAGLDIAVETPTLSQISVAVMKKYTSLSK